MADVTLTVDGRQVRAPAGTLLIEACKSAGIEVPSFCYYPGLSLQGACRMCLVEVAKMAKLQTACTVRVTEGMVATKNRAEQTTYHIHVRQLSFTIRRARSTAWPKS
jgi:NADH-quinone oxidoreductase subunit G